jgi:hypothetical protein
LLGWRQPSTFFFVSETGNFTARYEQADHKRGGRYWKAYRKHHGKLSPRYLGKPETITLIYNKSVEEALHSLPPVKVLLIHSSPMFSSISYTDDTAYSTLNIEFLNKTSYFFHAKNSIHTNSTIIVDGCHYTDGFADSYYHGIADSGA